MWETIREHVLDKPTTSEAQYQHSLNTMALNTATQTSSMFGGEPGLWQFPLSNSEYSPDYLNESPIDDESIFSGLTEVTSPTLVSQRPMPEFVQPHDLHTHDPDASTISPNNKPEFSSTEDRINRIHVQLRVIYARSASSTYVDGCS